MKLLLSTRKQDPYTIESLAQRLGFNGIELLVSSRTEKIETGDTKRIKEAWAGSQLKTVKVVHAPNGIYDQPRFISALANSVTIAKALGAEIVNIHPASCHSSFGGRANVLAGIQQIKKIPGGARGIKVCYEVLGLPNPQKPNHALQQAYANPIAWAGDVLEWGLHGTIDITHIFSWGEDPVRIIKQLGKRIGHVHISDYNSEEGQHLFPGEGEVPWDEVLAALKEHAPSDLYLTFEPSNRYNLAEKEMEERLQKAIKYIRKRLR
ncbi:MAG: sugar phosphate isomerase/epimerase [Candidatus Andersenbacteria bacterium]|nr:sugar phosphate isomerase/epimerase [Candidatus Andersenbacteria bacterium]